MLNRSWLYNGNFFDYQINNIFIQSLKTAALPDMKAMTAPSWSRHAFINFLIKQVFYKSFFYGYRKPTDIISCKIEATPNSTE